MAPDEREVIRLAAMEISRISPTMPRAYAYGNLVEVQQQHFHADKHQDDGQAVFEQLKSLGHIGEQKIHGPQPENGEDVVDGQRLLDELLAIVIWLASVLVWPQPSLRVCGKSAMIGRVSRGMQAMTVRTGRMAKVSASFPTSGVMIPPRP